MIDASTAFGMLAQLAADGYVSSIAHSEGKYHVHVSRDRARSWTARSANLAKAVELVTADISAAIKGLEV